jgi:hypothetical protein
MGVIDIIVKIPTPGNQAFTLARIGKNLTPVRLKPASSRVCVEAIVGTDRALPGFPR